MSSRRRHYSRSRSRSAERRRRHSPERRRERSPDRRRHRGDNNERKDFDPTQFQLYRYDGEGAHPLSSRPEFAVEKSEKADRDQPRRRHEDEFRERDRSYNDRYNRDALNFTVERDKFGHRQRSPGGDGRVMSDRWDGPDRGRMQVSMRRDDRDRWERLPQMRGGPQIEAPYDNERGRAMDYRADDRSGRGAEPTETVQYPRWDRYQRDVRQNEREFGLGFGEQRTQLGSQTQFPNRNTYGSNQYGRFAESRTPHYDSGATRRGQQFDNWRGGRRGRGTTVVYRPGEPEKPTMNLFDPQAVPKGRGYFEHDDRQGDRGRGRGGFRGGFGWRGRGRGRPPTNTYSRAGDSEEDMWKHDMYEAEDNMNNKEKDEAKPENN